VCGICGQWKAGGARGDVLERMNRTLVHRGPDDAGQVLLGEAGLAMCRLSIIDLEGGRQPLCNEDETVWVVCNGEIYNHAELRRELEAAGHRFRTRSDTEVLVHLYEEHGPGLVDRLRGMFAFALWDTRKRRMLLCRDRFGQKPLFYCHEGDMLLFGSELKAVLAGRETEPELDLGSLDDYLALRFVPSPQTMLRNVCKLPAGHMLVLDKSGVDVRRWFDLAYTPKQSISDEDAVAELRERLEDAVQSRMVADVRVGAYLSGGMDSSLIVAMMPGRGVPTFSIGVAEDDFNELPFAREVADACGTEHHEETVTPDLVRLLPRMVYHLDEPSDPIAACMWHSAALASRHVKVVLGGDGGDEVFAGFDRYFGFKWVKAYAALPAALRRFVLGPMLRLLPDSAGYKTLTQKLRWLHDLSFFRGGRRYAEATAFFRFGSGDKDGLYTADAAGRLAGRDPLECIVQAFDDAQANDDLDRMLRADMVTRLTEHSLMLTDRMSMAHGLEARCPLLDHELAQFVATLPTHLKMRGRDLKHAMRRVARDYLPRSICDRPKQGFMFPLGYWMKGPLLPVVQELVTDCALVDAGIFRADAIATLVAEHVAGRSDHHNRLWMLLNLDAWYRMTLQGESPDAVADRLASKVKTPATT